MNASKAIWFLGFGLLLLFVSFGAGWIFFHKPATPPVVSAEYYCLLEHSRTDFISDNPPIYHLTCTKGYGDKAQSIPINEFYGSEHILNAEGWTKCIIEENGLRKFANCENHSTPLPSFPATQNMGR